MEKIKYFLPTLLFVSWFNTADAQFLSPHIDLIGINGGVYTSTSNNYWPFVDGHIFRLAVPLLFNKVGVGLDGYHFMGGGDKEGYNSEFYYHTALPVYLYINFMKRKINKRVGSELNLFAGGSRWAQSEYAYEWHRGLDIWYVSLEAQYILYNVLSLKLSTTYYD